MPSVGAVTSNLNVVTKSAAYTAAANDFVLVSASSTAVTITLPASPVANSMVAVKKTDSGTNAVTIATTVGLVNGAATYPLTTSGATAVLQFDGTNWQLLATAVTGLPTGGSSGQVLTKATATNFDATWVTPSAGASTSAGAFPAWTSGRQFTAPIVLTGTNSSTSLSAFYTYFIPVQVPNPCTISNIRFAWSNPTGTSNMIFAVYSDISGTTSGGPNQQLYTGAVTVTTAVQWFTQSVNLTVTGQRILWMAFYGSGSSALVCGSSTTTVSTFVLPGVDPPTANGVGLRTAVSTNWGTSLPNNWSNTAMSYMGGPQPIISFQIA